MTNTDKDLNAENPVTPNAIGVLETPDAPQPEPMPPKNKGGRPRKPRRNPDLTADPTWVIYRSSGQHAEGHIVREIHEDGRSDGIVIVENGMAQVSLLQSEEWRSWYRPALVSVAAGTKPRDPLQDATVRIVRAETEGSAAASAAAREPSPNGGGKQYDMPWVSADGATSENPTPRRRRAKHPALEPAPVAPLDWISLNPTPRRRRAKHPALEPAPVAPRFSPLDWMNLEFSAENFLAAVRGKNEIEARRYLGFLQAVAKHSLADLTNA